MSLTSFIAEPDIKAKLRETFPSIRFQLEQKPVRNALTNHYVLIGTAFDYLMHWYLQKRYTHAKDKPWVAEIAAIRQYNQIAALYTTQVAKQAVKFVVNAKQHHKQFVEDSVLTDDVRTTGKTPTPRREKSGREPADGNTSPRLETVPYSIEQPQASSSHLSIALSAAVPLRVLALYERQGPDENDLEAARQVGTPLASKGDRLLFRSGVPGETADIFNRCWQCSHLRHVLMEGEKDGRGLAKLVVGMIFLPACMAKELCRQAGKGRKGK